MQSLKKIMEEMGFNKDAPLESQKAFFRHLLAAAKPFDQNKPDVEKPQQLEFEFSEDKQVS